MIDKIKKGIVTKRGFTSDPIVIFVVLIIFTLIIISFHLIFSVIDANNNDIISYDNEPIIMAESLLYSFLEGKVSHKGIECFGDDKTKDYEYTGKEMLYANYNCGVVLRADSDDGVNFRKELEELIPLFDQAQTTQINAILYEDGVLSDTQMIYSSIKTPGCKVYSSDSYVFLPVDSGLIKVELKLSEHRDDLQCY